MDPLSTSALETPAPNPTPSNRKPIIDQKFGYKSKVVGFDYINHLFQRVAGKEVAFENVDFSYTIFDTCYFRKCVFENCNFTGCRFKDCNLYGSGFVGCKFDYVFFDKTILDVETLDAGPKEENLRDKFARTLRTNFQSLGDYPAVNKAVQVELAAKQEHLFNAWRSDKPYYRKKYARGKRIKMFFSWGGFKFFDYLWGNGESSWKLLRTILLLLFCMAFFDMRVANRNVGLIGDLTLSVKHAAAIFFGAGNTQGYGELYLTSVLFIRLFMMAFLLSIIIKRFSRR